MANNRREHYRKTKKSRMRELKHSRPGWYGLICALAALALFVYSVTQSFLAAGDADILVTGSVSLVGLVLAVGAFLLGIIGIRESKVRPAPPRAAIVLGAMMTVVLGGLYVGGIIGFL